jgi:hypothetical protein
VDPGAPPLTPDASARTAREAAIDAAGIGTFDWDLRTGRLRWDDHLLAMSGLTQQSFGGTAEAFTALVHPGDRAHVGAAVRAAVQARGRYQAEYRIVQPGGSVRWIVAQGQVVDGPGGTASRLVGAAFDVTHHRAPADRVAARAALLADVNSQLVGTLDPEEGVARLAQIICPALADWCVITLVGADQASLRDLRDLGWWHLDPAQLPLVEQYAATRLEALGEDSHLMRVLRSSKPVVMLSGATGTIRGLLRDSPAREALLALAPESAAILPLFGRGGIVGLLSVFNGSTRDLTGDDLATLREIADQAGLAVDNARLYAAQRDLAQSLQRSLLTQPTHRPGLEISVRYVPAAAAAQVGGDWYDVLPQREGATTLVIGDVVGHDTEAVAAMGQLRGMLRGIALSGSDGPLNVVTKLDEVIAGLGSEITATAVVAWLEGDVLRWTNAGHPAPVLVPARGTVRSLAGPSCDLLLGIDPTTSRAEPQVRIGPGDTLLLYTDGLVERRGQSLDAGTRRLLSTLAAVRALPLDALCDQVLARLLPAKPEDDVAVLAVRRRPAG